MCRTSDMTLITISIHSGESRVDESRRREPTFNRLIQGALKLR